MLQDASAQVGGGKDKRKFIAPVETPKTFIPAPPVKVDPRAVQSPKLIPGPVDHFTGRVTGIDLESWSFGVLGNSGQRTFRFGNGCILRNGVMSFSLEDLRVGDSVAGISDQGTIGGLISYLAVQVDSSEGSTLRAVTINDVNVETRHIQVTPYQVGGGGGRSMAFPYTGAVVFLNKMKAPWEEIKAGDRGVMVFSGSNRLTHLVLNRAGPQSETTTAKKKAELVDLRFTTVRGTVTTIDRTAGTFLFVPDGKHNGPKSPANLLCTVGNHLIVNRKGIETWGGLPEGAQVSFFFDAAGFAAYALVHEGPNKNRTLAYGTVEGVDAEMKMVNVNVFTAGRPQESISLNFEEIRTRKQIAGEILNFEEIDVEYAIDDVRITRLGRSDGSFRIEDVRIGEPVLFVSLRATMTDLLITRK